MKGPMQRHNVGIDTNTDRNREVSHAGIELEISLRHSCDKIRHGKSLLRTGQFKTIKAAPKRMRVSGGGKKTEGGARGIKTG
jgi:hypothetical protein